MRGNEMAALDAGGKPAPAPGEYHHEGTKDTKEECFPQRRKGARVVISTKGRNLSQIPRRRSG